MVGRDQEPWGTQPRGFLCRVKARHRPFQVLPAPQSRLRRGERGS